MFTGLQLLSKITEIYLELRNNKTYTDSTLIWVLENNLGQAHDMVYALLSDKTKFDNCVVLEESPGVLGFWTCEKNKLMMDDALKMLIEFNRLAFASNFISVNEDKNRVGQKAREMLVAQIEGMKEYTIMKGTGMKRVISSIFREDLTVEPGKHDDLQRALSMLNYAAELLKHNQLPITYDIIDNIRAKRPIDATLDANLKQSKRQKMDQQ